MGNFNNDIAIATTGRRGRRKGRRRRKRRRRGNSRGNGRVRGRIGIGGRGRTKERRSFFILYLTLLRLRNIRLGNYSTMSFNIGTQLKDSKEGNRKGNKKHNGRLTLNSFHMFHEGGKVKGEDVRVILDYGLFYRNTTDYGF